MSSFDRDSRGRLGLFGILGLCAFAVLTARLFQLQIVEHERYDRVSRDQHEARQKKPPLRGRLLDRLGEPLAYSITNNRLHVVPRTLNQQPDRDARVAELARAADMTVPEVEKKLRKNPWSVTFIERKPVLSEELDRVVTPGISRELTPKRVYPFGISAAHVTGFINVDQVGTEGTERAFQERLRGEPGWASYFRDGTGQLHPGKEKRPVPGDDYVLTIDSYLQDVAYQKLAEGVARLHAQNGWAIVLDVKTGDILAMANAPSYDPTFFEKFDRENYRNRILSDVIEPGSTIKAITAAAALEEGKRRPDTPVNCEGGRWRFHDRTISDHEGMGTVPFIDTFVHSSNVGMAKVGVALGAERMHYWLRRFGFGERTGVGLPGEAPGRVVPLERWSAQTPASVAFGYELQVTAIQMALAYAALANDGILMKPRLIREIRSPDGRVLESFPVRENRRVVSSETARTMRQFMREVVERGTGREAGVSWCEVGGKTGTAKKLDPITKRYSYRHYSSFIGIAPVDHPRFLCYVVVNEPKGDIYGGRAAAPIFRGILEASARSPHPILRPDWDIVAPPPIARGPVQTIGDGLIRGYIGVTTDAAAAETTAAGARDRVIRDRERRAREQAVWAAEHPTLARRLAQAVARKAAVAESLAIATGDSAALARLNPPPPPPATGPILPDFTHLTRRQVQRQLNALGVTNARFAGRGIVIHQEPDPGVRLATPDMPLLLILDSRDKLPAGKEGDD